MEDKFGNLDELQIIQNAQNGDEEAMTYLMEKYKSMVRVLSRPLFLMDGDKDDLLQEGMIGLFKAVRTYDAGKDTALRLLLIFVFPGNFILLLNYPTARRIYR